MTTRQPLSVTHSVRCFLILDNTFNISTHHLTLKPPLHYPLNHVLPLHLPTPYLTRTHFCTISRWPPKHGKMLEVTSSPTLKRQRSMRIWGKMLRINLLIHNSVDRNICHVWRMIIFFQVPHLSLPGPTINLL